MIKKSAQDKQKQNTEKLRERVDKMFTGISEIAKSTGVKVNESSPKLEMLENLTGHCEDHVFWKNFNKAAPMLFCALMENNNSIKQVRDMSFMEELLKVKTLTQLMQKKLEKGDADIDVIEYSMATSMLENKLNVLQSLNTTVEGDNDEKMTLNIQGANKSMVIDLTKLKDCI